MRYLLLSVICCFLVWISSSVVNADELVNGLALKIQDKTQVISKGYSAVSIDWGSAQPDVRIADGSFSAQWQGSLLVQQQGTHQLFAFVEGDLDVLVADKSVLTGSSRSEARWINGTPFKPELGLQPIVVKFKKTKPAARVHLFWSSETFPLEPIPFHLLFSEKLPDDGFALGRDLFLQSRCAGCHSDSSIEPPLDSPDLSRSVADLDAEWIVNKLQGNLAGQMPHFDFTIEEAADVATFLKSQAVKLKLSALPKAAKKRNDSLDRADGETLIRSLGCLACHSLKSDGIESVAALGGVDLSGIGLKRSPEWFFQWLKDPKSLNARHRMPVFKLTATERRQLSLALANLKTKPNQTVARNRLDAALARDSKASIQRGRQLVISTGCRSCHQIRGVEPKAVKIPEVVDWESSCLAKPTRQPWKPSYPTLAIRSNRRAIETFIVKVKSNRPPNSDPSFRASQFENGKRLLEVKGCLACHPRYQSGGLGSTAATLASNHKPLQGMAPAMVPPSLSAIGDKLLDDALDKAIRGEQEVRKPWLKVRMPRFKHSQTEAAAISAYLIAHDRIPGKAPGQNIPLVHKKVDDQELLIGRALVGPKGFSCIACHQVGDYVPKKTALGTRGSDLLALGQRMRPEFFMRWTHSPLRIVPGLEMPSYNKPAKGVLGNDVNRQLRTLWQTLNDTRFEAPTNPSAVEQYLVVPKGPARIVRDVFENPKNNGGGYVARSLALGFGNQHSVLFDLDRFAIRAWTFGDFARQRTSGKSWFWDMAGSYVLKGFRSESEFSLVPSGGATQSNPIVKPHRDNGTVGRLNSYRPYGEGVEVNYEIVFKLGDLQRVGIVERITPFNNGVTSGFQRIISAVAVPAGYDLAITQPASPASGALGSPKIWRIPKNDGPKFKADGRGLQTAILESRSGVASALIEYQSQLQPNALAVKLKPVDPIPAHKITSMPGFEGTQLPLPGSIMPTALTTRTDGALAFTSLKGHVYLAKDSNNDGMEDRLELIDEGLAAPYGILQDGDSWLVSHKPEVIRLKDTNGDTRADERSVFATGWGYNDNYHDWACSLIRNSTGEFFLGLGGDYSQKGRPKEFCRWRGKVVRISSTGVVSAFSHGFRYPTGLAIDSQDRLFGTDNQGVQNCFNEINHLQDGAHYGVPALHEQDLKVNAIQPAIQVPHPWTRSVNGIAILPPDYPIKSIRGHGLGCEYNGKHLIRFTYHEVDGILQGATFFMSKPNFPNDNENFLGPINIHVSKAGEIYVGSIHDSGWLGGLNTGSIVKLTPGESMPNGIQDIQATADGFRIDFFHPVDKVAATDPDRYSVSAYTRVWKGGYATADSGRYSPKVQSAKLNDDGKSVFLSVDRRETGYVYELNCKFKHNGEALWPTTGHYTLHRIPQ